MDYRFNIFLLYQTFRQFFSRYSSIIIFLKGFEEVFIALFGHQEYQEPYKRI
jgi:hypothetical protein